MANFQIPCNEIITIPIQLLNAGGVPVAIPSGETFNVSSTKPASLQVTLGTTSGGAPAVVIKPLVQASPNLVVMASDDARGFAFNLIVDVVAVVDNTPVSINLDTAHATNVSQPIPTNPGP
jgi:hypothetical protein